MTDWADEIAEDLLCQWTQYAKEYQTALAFDPVQLAVALRKARSDALEDVEAELCKRTIYRRHHLIAAIRALKEKDDAN